MNFRADEQAPMEVIPNPGAEMSHEVIAADVIGAAKSIANCESLIKPYALSTDSRSQISLRFSADLWRIKSVEIPKYRAIRKVALIEILAGTPRDFAHYAKILVEQKVAAKCRIGTAAQ